VNRYDIILGKDPPPAPPPCCRRMIVGSRNSGKTTALLRILNIYLKLGYPCLLCIIKSQESFILNMLGAMIENNPKRMKNLKTCSMSNERYMYGHPYLFYDNVDFYMDRFQMLPPDKIVYATCDESQLLKYRESFGSRVMNILGLKWDVFLAEELVNKKVKIELIFE